MDSVCLLRSCHRDLLFVFVIFQSPDHFLSTVGPQAQRLKEMSKARIQKQPQAVKIKQTITVF